MTTAEMALSETVGVDVQVHIDLLPELEKRIEKIARIARKLSVPEPTITILGRSETRETGEWTGQVEVHHWLHLHVEGPAPRIAGWQVLGRIDHLPDGNLIVASPDSDLDISAYRTVENVCDHCGLRRNRLSTVLLRGADNAIKQVGRTCLKDFTGHDNPEQLAALFDQIIDLFDGLRRADGERGLGRSETDIEFFLAHVACGIRVRGWMSRAKSNQTGEISSSGWATENIRLISHPQHDRYGNTIKSIQPTEADTALSQAALTWVREVVAAKPIDERSDYEHNLVVACASDYLRAHTDGIVASVIAGYQRTQREAADAAGRPTSQHVGTVKSKISCVVTVLWIKEIHGAYGVTNLHRMVDADGNLFTWFASSEKLKVDRQYKLTGTVKAHDEFRGEKQTVLTRCKALPV